MEYYSAIKKNETMPSVATWIILSEVSQTNMWYHLYVESKKDPNELFTEQIHIYRKQMYGDQRVKVGAINQEFEMSRYKVL